MPTPLRSMPEDVRRLRVAWPSLATTIPDLTPDLEQEFRFGQRITRTERGYIMGGTMKGGSSSMWYPVTQTQYHAFRRWQTHEGLQEGRDDEAQARLTALLTRHGIALVTRRQPQTTSVRKDDPTPHPGYGSLYKDMVGILEGLPESHLHRASLRRIQLGGWGPDAAKASAYQDAGVHMYDFACRGARRTFLGLFLHELGHAHEAALSEDDKATLMASWRVLVEEDAFVGIEFLLDPPTRRLYQRIVFSEFLAETYMIYAATGEALRRMIEGLAGRAGEAWRRAYAVFKATFDDAEYA